MAIERSWKHTPPPPEVIEQKMLAATTAKVRAKPKTEESDLQIMCVDWFSYRFPQYYESLFAVPNGGHRIKSVGKRLKAEGVKKGVADLFLDIPKGGYHGLRIEMKYGRNTQSPEQKTFQKTAEANGYKYTLCYTFEEFEKIIIEYLG